MRWDREEVEERGRRYVDHVCGPHRIGQGHHEEARRDGRPWMLSTRGRDVGTFATVREARLAAEGSSVAPRIRRAA